ncbi:MAG: dihydrolipoyl dehydrogenase [Hyphomicrobiales bacterium]
MSNQTYDVAIIGAGPGGYVTAIRAKQLGLSVVVIEREHYGGICLNWGCIPTKALLRSSEQYHMMAHRAEEFGLKVEGASFDLEKIVARSRGIAKQMNGGIQFLFKKNKVDVVDGEAKIKAKGVIGVTANGKALPDVKAKNIIIATGARARTFPGMEPEGKYIWTYKQALVADSVPERLLVIGSGAIGIEFASFFNALGSNTTVVEVMDRVLPVEDKDISAHALKQFKKQGMEILTSSKVDKLTPGKNDITATLTLKNGKTEERTYDRVILAVGIVGNVENIGLETVGVKHERSHIVVDQWSKTNVDGIYAIGDVAGPPWLAHKASHEGIICIEKIAGEKDVHPLNPKGIPGCTYCHPQVASVGYTEEKAKEAGFKVKVGKFPFVGNGKAVALGEPEGIIKTVFDAKTGELLGAHMIGAEVTELIQGYVIAMGLETTEKELMHTVFAHPTLSEMMHESVLDAYGKMIHM